MRILVLIHEYPPVGGGGGRVAQDLCEGFLKKGHEVQILTAHCEDLPFKEEQAGIMIHRLKSWRRLPFKADIRAMAGYILASFLNGLKIIRQWKPDLIHVHFAVPAGVAAWALSRFTGIPYVMTAHLGDVPGGTPEKTGKWFRWIFPFTPPIWKKAAHIAAVSEFTKSLADKHYPVPIHVIHNGVDINILDPGEIFVNDIPQIVFAARFVEQKNPLNLIKILARIKDLPWKFKMIGDGVLKPEVIRLIEEFELQDRIELPGWVTPEEVIQAYGESDIFFMPSYSEGLPVTGVQALSMGLALILSRAGGNVELVKEKNGFLVEPDDHEAFETAFRTLLSDKDRLLEARRSSREVANFFDLPHIIDQYEQAFQQILSNH
ncbi:MAG: glycosyltransferase family 4 protein [Anaerolineaceae bacterium]|nr:glycosyltransferase family 4 protein [Anaerolineaceae bacterium]